MARSSTAEAKLPGGCGPPVGWRRGELPAAGLDAVIFDMDGVVTDTADAHAATWKRLFDEYLQNQAPRNGEDLRPFDPAADYRAHVDGKPRYDGVRSFLQSRGIALPFGDPNDGPEAETICGLGNRKNAYFHDWLAGNQVRIYPATVALLKALRTAGIGIGIFSSSRNSEVVLGKAGLGGLFDVSVGGSDLARLGLPGKPDPAMLRETAARLGSSPERTVVVEDAISGVTAGMAGGFGLVVGINRGDYADELVAQGADLVVEDLGELTFDADRGFTIKMLSDLASVWDREDEVRARLGGRKIALFLDYDGTLSPIVEDFRTAFLAADVRQLVAELTKRCTVAVVSGRDLRDIKSLVGLESIIYAGSHGFEIEAPGRLRETHQEGLAFLPDLDQAEHGLEEALHGIEGHAVERKRFAIAVHYRRVTEPDVRRIAAAVDRVVERHPRLRKSYGKKVLQVQPRADWNKGRAVAWLLQQLDLDRDDVLPIYIGDDLTDEHAFRSLAGRGLGIAVGDEQRPTAADYSLTTPKEVGRFLHFLADVIDKGAR